MFSDSNEDCWYKNWFDSPYYHLLYNNHDQKEAGEFIRNLVTILNPAPGARMLDLACGKGRHSLALHGLGFDVTGIDLSHASIAEAKKSEVPGLEFFEHDMRRPFRINYFDGVFNFFTSFGYFEDHRDNRQVVDAVAKGLKKDGFFVIDFFNAAVVEKMIAASPAGEKKVDEVCFRWKKRIENEMIIKNISFSDKGKEYQYTEHVQLLSANDFRNILAPHFEIEKTFGDYRLSPFDENSSSRLIILARKRSV